MDKETKPTNSCKRHESLCRLCRCGSDCFSETLSGKFIVTKENVPFENLLDYFITSTEREVNEHHACQVIPIMSSSLQTVMVCIFKGKGRWILYDEYGENYHYIQKGNTR